MSEIKIYFNPLDARSLETYQIPVGTQLIDFLQEYYPIGFKGSLIVYVGTDRLEIADLDYEVQDTDCVTMLVMPTGAVGAYLVANWATLLIQAAVGAAVGLAIGFLFPPASFRGGDSGEESPVYSINVTRNRSRLGDPIAAHYGAVSYPPDFAAAPYVFFAEESNDMFVDELLCLGHGEYIIDEIYIGESPVTTIEPGSVQYWVYGPQDHIQIMGTIEADILAKVSGSSTPYPFAENMFTSPEVENYQFSDDVSDVVAAPVAFSGDANAADIDPVTGEYILGNITGFPDTTDFSIGDVLTIAGTASNNGDFTIGSIVDNGDTTLTLFEQWTFINNVVEEIPISGTYTLNTTLDSMLAGPYRAQKLGQEVDRCYCDIIFPGGLMKIESDGDQKFRSIDMVLTFQQINETTGAPIGAPVIVNKNYNARQQNALRSTVDSGPLTPGAYEVTVERLTPYAKAGRDLEDTIWSGLKSHVVLETNPVYGNVTLMAIRLKATNALGSAARARVRITASRVLASGDSDNPITVFKDIWANPDYGMKRSLDELDLIAIDSLEIDYGQAGGPTFNGSFDSKGAGWEALEQSVALAGARVVQQNALTTVIQDEVQPVRRAMFTTANIVPDSLEILYTFDPAGDFDGVTVEFRDPETFDPMFVTYPVTSVNPEYINLFGCTDSVYASQYAVYIWNVKNQRRKVINFTTELEGLIPIFGDRIAVSHSLPDWGQSGIVVEQISDLSIRVDQALDWSTGSLMIFREGRGRPLLPVSVSPGKTQDIVLFSAPPPLTIFAPSVREPTLYSFGSTYTVIKDFLISKVEPQDETHVRIHAQVYDETIYSGGPPHMGGQA